MKLSDYIGSKLSCTKVKLGLGELSVDKLIENANYIGFKPEPEDSYTERITGLVAYNAPYSWFETPKLSEEVVVLCYREDSKKVDTARIKKWVESRKELLEGQGQKAVVSREEKEQYKLSVLSKTSYTTKLVPILIDFGKAEAYILSISSKVLEDVLSYLTAVGVESVEIVTSDDLDKNDFLTWLWWRYDYNLAFNTETEEITLNGNATIQYEGVTTTTKGGINELRTAMATPGASVVKIGVEREASAGPRAQTFDVNTDLQITSFAHKIKFEQDDLDLCVAEIMLLELESVYALVSECYRMYQEALASGESITDEIRNVWGRETFCTKNVDL